MLTTLVLASLCVLGEPQLAVTVQGFIRPMESVFATSFVTLPTFAYETHFIVRQGGRPGVIRLRTSSPVRTMGNGTVLIETCNPVS